MNIEPLHPVGASHRPLRVAVRDEIRRWIIEGRLPQGERIMEEDLAQELGVSRNPVREALQTLAHEGFVELEPRRGARVMVLTDERAADVFEVREALEGLVAKLAAERRSEAQLAAMRALIVEGRLLLESEDVRDLPRLNSHFHALLTEAANSPTLTELLEGLTHLIQWLYTRRVRERGTWSWDEHTAIAAAIEERNAAKAQALAAHHIRNARQAYFTSTT